jgi:hypothetical protein
MRGGAQSHLCDGGGYYIVKFQNNPQHIRVLANEMPETPAGGKPTASFLFLACSRLVKSALCRCRDWPNGPIACGALCLGAVIIRQFGMTSKAC